jgi:hypothetical protein
MERSTMTTIAIRKALAEAFPMLQTRPRKPHGYSWFDGEPRRGSNSNRIVHAVARDDTSPAELKLSVSSRLIEMGLIPSKPTVLRESAEPELLELTREELRLFRKHF